MSDTAADMEAMEREKRQADIAATWARGASDYEQARKTRRESFWYPVVVAGGLMGGGAAVAALVMRVAGAG